MIFMTRFSAVPRRQRSPVFPYFHPGSASARPLQKHNIQERDMNWETPKATDLRFGFEITMYVANR